MWAGSVVVNMSERSSAGRMEIGLCTLFVLLRSGMEMEVSLSDIVFVVESRSSRGTTLTRSIQTRVSTAWVFSPNCFYAVVALLSRGSLEKSSWPSSAGIHYKTWHLDGTSVAAAYLGLRAKRDVHMTVLLFGACFVAMCG